MPWAPDLQVVYEHYHRYHFAAATVTGRRVLDLACGEGYGTAVLATSAADVVGIDIDRGTIQHASSSYRLPNLRFDEGSMLDLSRYEVGSFDVVTCFEALEHVTEHDVLIGEVRRVLRPEGLFLVSTPDRLTYSGHLHQDNPFHLRELSRQEFEELLCDNFANVAMWGQTVAAGSLLVPITPPSGTEGGQALAIQQQDGRWVLTDEVRPTYLIGVASTGPIPDLPGLSSLVDVDLQLVRRTQHELQRAVRELREVEERSARLDGALHETRSELANLREVLGSREAEIGRVHTELALAEARAAGTLGALLDVHGALQARDRRIHALAGRVSRLRSELRESLAVGNRATERWQASAAQLAEIENSAAIRLLRRYRRAIDGIAPAGSRRRVQYTRMIWGVGGRPPGTPPRAGVDCSVLDLGLLSSATPEVSIVIPVHDHWDVTQACLRSIGASTPSASYEVVVVDDASQDPTRHALTTVEGVRVVRLDRNVGYLHACNEGARRARGRYILLLNNDVEVVDGWLDALIDAMESHASVGAVGAKLVYPDGRLQEAGSIIWSDGHGWNYGRGNDPHHPAFCFVREVDYCSAACLMVRRDLFERLGGFDERYAPAYYEDSDLAFGIRSLGYRVLYQPDAVVVHHEGVSHGTDVSVGTKRFQDLNRAEFVKKWSEQLARQLPNSVDNVGIARSRGERRRVVVVDHMVPAWDRDSGSRRMYEILGQFQGLGLKVTLVADNRQRLEPYTSRLQQRGVEVLYGEWDVVASLRAVAEEVELVVLSRPLVACQHAAMMREILPRAALVYDTVDLHHVRESRRALVEQDPAVAQVAAAHREIELGLVRASDATFVVSPDERELLAREVPGKPIYVVPNIHRVVGSTQPFERRSGLLFVGGFQHPPNVDAVLWFSQQIMPALREFMPDIRLYVAGSHTPRQVHDLASDNITVLGWVEDLSDLYQECRLFVAPLRFGAGIKGKVGESLSHGLPVVTTRVGAEGMGLRHGRDVLVADDAGDFAREVARAYLDSELWTALAAQGRLRILEQFTPEAVRARLAEALVQVRPSRPDVATIAALNARLAPPATSTLAAP